MQPIAHDHPPDEDPERDDPHEHANRETRVLAGEALKVRARDHPAIRAAGQHHASVNHAVREPPLIARCSRHTNGTGTPGFHWRRWPHDAHSS